MEPTKQPVIKMLEFKTGVLKDMPAIMYDDETRCVMTHVFWQDGVPTHLASQCQYKPTDGKPERITRPEFYTLANCNLFTHWPAQAAQEAVEGRPKHVRQIAGKPDVEVAEVIAKAAVPATPSAMEFRAGGLTCVIPMEYEDYIALMVAISTNHVGATIS